MKNKRNKLILALILVLGAYALAWIWFSWKLTLILFLLDWCNGIQTSVKLSEKMDTHMKIPKSWLKDIFDQPVTRRDIK